LTKLRERKTDLQQSGVEWVQEMAAEFDPNGARIFTVLWVWPLMAYRIC
jgi:hypothetical protein